MADDHSATRYHKLYRRLLRLYPQPFRERFGAGMAQTFNDLCWERTRAGKGLFTFALWAFSETFIGIMKESLMHHKSIVRLALVTALVFVAPLLANRFIDGWNWNLFDFVFMGALLFGAGLTYELVAGKGGTVAYRAAVGIACTAGLLLIWINAAVGMIGDEDLANGMYFGVLAVGLVGALIARCRPRGMARALLATAAAQALVPLIAMIWVPAMAFTPSVAGVFGLNAFFIALWLISAGLFRKAARTQSPAVAGLVG